MKEITKTYSYDINLPVSLRSRRFLFLDIETTGLSSSNSRVYLIGFLYQEGGRWVFTQLFAESPYEERAVLVRAAAFASHFDLFVHFNGCQFDLPYLHGRCVEHGVDDSFMSTPSLDLYLELRGCKKLLGLPNCRLKTIESFLGLAREDKYDGGLLINVYYDYVKTRSEDELHLLLLHNEEDVTGMPSLLPMLCYSSLMSGRSIDDGKEPSLFITDKTLKAELELTESLPRPVSAKILNIRIEAEDRQLSLLLPIHSGELLYFFTDYKNYYYLPEEGVAIHKSVATYVDKNHREPAKARNCYTKKTGVFVPVPSNSPGRLFRKSWGGQTYREIDDELKSDVCFWRRYVVDAFRLLR